MNASRSKKLINFSREDLSRIVRLITGHNVLNYHMSLTTPGHTALCRFCGEENEIFYHFVTNCPCLMTYRSQAFKDREGPAMEDWDPDEVLQFSKITGISDAVDFYAAMDSLSDFGGGDEEMVGV